MCAYHERLIAMHTYLQTVQRIAVLCMLFGLHTACAVEASKRPHIVFFLADDLGWSDVSFHGSKQIPTPNIDALARDGIILHQHYVQSICSPSRAALMTGKYPIRLGFQDFVISASAPWGLPLSEKILPQYLKCLNYRTYAVGKWHLGFFKEEYLPFRRGFDSFFGYYSGVEDYFTHYSNQIDYKGLDLHDNCRNAREYNGTYGPDLFTEKAREIIFNHDPSEPMFLYVAQQAPHSGNFGGCALQCTSKYVDPLAHIQDEGRRVYAGMVSSMDESVGEVFDALEQAGMLDNTIFVFTSDNGGPAEVHDGTRASNYPLRGTKLTNWEGAIRSPAFIWSPLLRRQSRVYNQMMHITDWLPTLLSAVGGLDALSELVDIDGVNQWPSFTESAPPPRSEILVNINPMDGTEAIRNGKFKLIKGKIKKYDFNGWYDIEGNPIENGIVPKQTPKEISQYEETYKNVFKHSKVPHILQLKYGKNPYELLYCNPGTCNDVHVNCSQRRPTADNCKPEKEACLFDVISDPCEFYNIAKFQPEVVADLQRRLDLYKGVMIPPFINFRDPTSNPKLHDDTWIPWRSPGVCIND